MATAIVSLSTQTASDAIGAGERVGAAGFEFTAEAVANHGRKYGRPAPQGVKRVAAAAEATAAATESGWEWSANLKERRRALQPARRP
jgi:hypothetical protein